MTIAGEFTLRRPPVDRGSMGGVRTEVDKMISCKGNGSDINPCEFDGTWLCKNPDCKSPVLTSTMYGARPSGCPKVDKWNSKISNPSKEK